MTCESHGCTNPATIRLRVMGLPFGAFCEPCCDYEQARCKVIGMPVEVVPLDYGYGNVRTPDKEEISQ